MEKVLYKGKRELTMAQFEALSSIDENTDYNIMDYPDNGMTNAQLSEVLNYSRLFSPGYITICLDDGIFKNGHIIQLQLVDGIRVWKDISYIVHLDEELRNELSKCEHIDVIYDKSDDAKNFGYDAGLTHGTSITSDFSKYKKLICYGQREYEGFSVEVDLEHVTPATNNYTGYNMYFAIYSDSKPYVRQCGAIVNSAKSNFRAFFEQKVLASGNDNSVGYFTKIEGVF